MASMGGERSGIENARRHGARRQVRFGLLQYTLLAGGLAVGAATASANGATFADDLTAERDITSVKAVFEPERTNQYVLDVEAALARAQAAHGAIPQAAADEIARKASTRYAPLAEIMTEQKRVRHRMVALINVWRKSLTPGSRQYLHYGATTVDIYDTALTLQLRRSALILIGRLREIEAALIKMARENQDAIMAGRTLGQHALPITFGKKVSTWLAENRRNIERLKHVLAELEQSAILKGAVGTYAGLGENAIAIERTFAGQLGLRAPYPDDWHGTRDVYANYALTLALISKTFGAIGQELFLLQTTDIGETDEPRDPNSVSSSSMAQKTNPRHSEALIMGARTIPRLAEVVLDDVVNFFERDNTSGPDEVLVRISIESERNLDTAMELVSQLVVNRSAMRENLERTKGFIMAQRVAFALSPMLGKDEADELVRAIIHKAISEKMDFRSALLKDPTTSRLLAPAAVDELLQPEGYLGLAREGVDAVVAHVEALRQTDPPIVAQTAKGP
jgi:adenylosuccinate lyase